MMLVVIKSDRLLRYKTFKCVLIDKCIPYILSIHFFMFCGSLEILLVLGKTNCHFNTCYCL